MARNLPYDRPARVADGIYHLIAGVVMGELADPRVENVTVTRVKMTRDLRICRIYFHMEGSTEEKRQLALKGLKSASGFVKRRIGEDINLKFMPDVEFFYDDEIDAMHRIEDLLDSAKR